MNASVSRMRTALLHAALLGIPLLGLAPAAHANDAADCRESRGYTRIDACTRLIDSGQLKGAALAAAYDNRATGKMQKSVDFPGAMADLNRAIELDPKNAAYYVDRGLAHMVNDAPAEAIPDFSRAIELEPGNAKAWYWRGQAKDARSDFDGAIADFSQAIKLEPQSGASEGRGRARASKRDFAGAIADFSREIELISRSNDDSAERKAGLASAYYYRANAKGDSGNHDGALADFTLAIKYDPEYAAAYAGRSKAKWGKGDAKGALADIDQAVKLSPDDPEVYATRGALKADIGDDYDGEMADFSRAIELDSKYVPAYLLRGMARDQHGDTEAAVADFNTVLTLDPRTASAYLERGKAKLDSGDLDAAIADVSRSLELDPTDGDAAKVRGIALFLKGDAARAAPDLALSQQLESDPYTALWLFLARSGAKTEGTKELKANTAKLDKKKWPAPVVALYLGKATPESALAAAKDANPKTQNDQLCEANFYVAEWYLLKDDRKAATPLLRDAAAHCPAYYIEGYDATAHLKQLGIALK